jgi:gliding motility-associated-like protein
MLRGFVHILILTLISVYTSAQDFSNKGKEFWAGYGYHQAMNSPNGDANSQNMVLYFTSDVSATVTVEMPLLGWTKTYQVSPNTVTESDTLPKSGSQDARLFSEDILNTGIRITSDNPIVAYAHIYSSANSAASLLFPVNTLGQEYYSLNFTQRSNTVGSNSWAFVVATEDNTTVEITPSANTLKHQAGQTFPVSLNRGQVYNLMGTTDDKNGVDLTGTKIRSVSTGTAGCKRIAVFSGSGRVSINCENAITSSDNLFQQVFPQSAWGKRFLTVPTSNLPNNFFRIAVSDPATVVTVDGVRATNLTKNFYYEINANTPKNIVSDKPVMVAQYITSSSDDITSPCGNSFGSKGDPEMIYLSPLEQTIDNVTLNSTSHYDITSHYINVVIKTSAVNSFTLDGNSSASAFKPHPGDPAYSFAVFEVQKGSHHLKADSGFNAIAYGYGDRESYGYNAGTNIKNLYEFVTVQNPYAISTNTCSNTPFVLAVTLPYQATSLVWDFGSNPNLTPSQNITQNNFDTSYDMDGRTLYVYKLKDSLRFNTTGTFPVKITIANESSDGCGNVEEIDYNLEVADPPKADFTITQAVCLRDTAKFRDASVGNANAIVKRKWDFGDATTDTVANPAKIYTQTGTFNVHVISINNIGCSADVTKPITIAPLPVGNFSLSSTSGCVKNPLTVTDLSTVTEGNITNRFWTFGDGTTTSSSDENPVSKNYDNPGHYTIKLTVQSDKGCKSDTVQKGVTILPSPVANFILPQICINDPAAVFVDSSYLPASAGGSLSYAWDFGDAGANAANPNISTVKNPEHRFSAPGSYNISLTTTSNAGCFSTITKPFVVSGIPVADFIVMDSASLCSNTRVQIQNNSSVAPGAITRIEITWDVDNAPQSVVTENAPSAGQIFSHIYPPSQTVRTYHIRLRAFSGITCADEKAVQITIQPSPKVTFSEVPATCLNDSAFTILQAKETTGLQGTFAFSGNGVAADGLFSPNVAGAGNAQIRYTFTTTAGCKDSAQQIIRVIQNPIVQLPAKIFVLEGGAVILEPVITGSVSKYMWTPATWLDNPNVKSPASTPVRDTTYKLSVSSPEGCTAYGDVTVVVLTNLGVPNAFSPNGDGINDVWNIPALQSFEQSVVQVFNRYGKIVFSSKGYREPWDGRFNGSLLPVGVYYYIINVGNGRKPYSGYVTILK